MIKLVLLIRKKTGMSDEDFRRYYENTHAILARQMLPQITTYRRNYVREEIRRSATGEIICEADSRPFDVITEQYFENRAAFDAAMLVFSQAEAAKRMADDEAELFDRSTIRAFLVEEYPLDGG
jgi:hypothetical protein